MPSPEEKGNKERGKRSANTTPLVQPLVYKALFIVIHYLMEREKWKSKQLHPLLTRNGSQRESNTCDLMPHQISTRLSLQAEDVEDFVTGSGQSKGSDGSKG